MDDTPDVGTDNDAPPVVVKKRIRVIGLEKRNGFKGVRDTLTKRLTVSPGVDHF